MRFLQSFQSVRILVCKWYQNLKCLKNANLSFSRLNDSDDRYLRQQSAFCTYGFDRKSSSPSFLAMEPLEVPFDSGIIAEGLQFPW